MATALTPHLSDETSGARAGRLPGGLLADAVLTGEDELRDFRDPFAFPAWDDYTASAVVMPQTVEEIQAGRAGGERAQGAALDTSTG